MKSREELQAELELSRAFEKERSVSDGRYAPKIVEKIVFWFIASLAAGLLAFVGKLVIDYLSNHYSP